jgi:hypothetical protein
MRAFIVRPFGAKDDKQDQPIDFDAAERELIDPALKWHGIEEHPVITEPRLGLELSSSSRKDFQKRQLAIHDRQAAPVATMAR